MGKVLVIGSGGAGKSTFARRLGKLLDIEVIHLDALYWNPGWVETPKAAWAETVAELVKRDSWIMDGSGAGKKSKAARTSTSKTFPVGIVCNCSGSWFLKTARIMS